VLDQPRSTQRYESKPRDDEPALVKQMLEVARRRPRWGYRRVAWALRQEEWQASAWPLGKLGARADLQCAWCGQMFELHCRLVAFGANACTFDNPFIFAVLRDDEQDSLRSQDTLLYRRADMFDGVGRDRGLDANAGS